MIQIAVWDNIGNVLLGVRLTKNPDNMYVKLLTQDDHAALESAPLFEELFADYEVKLHEVKTLAELEPLMPDLDYLVVHKENLPAEVLAKGTKLRLVQHLGQDYRGVPVGMARSMGVPVCATPLINYITVAEHAWALMLNLTKQMQQQRAQMEKRLYVERGWGATVPGLKVVEYLTLGLLGFGEIARPMARYAHAFGMRTIYWDKVRFPELEEEYHVEYVGWDELFQQSDVLSVHIPIKPETEKIIGAREIGLMKPTAFFINTARGKLVDEPALVDALRQRRLGGAGLDVFFEEPLPVDSPLHALHEDPAYNVTLTSHTAWQGPWTWVRDSMNIWQNVLNHLRGEPLQYGVRMSAHPMHPVRFGYCVPIFAWPGGNLFRTPSLPAVDTAGALRSAVEAEALGYDSIWVADHLMLGRDEAILEGWTTLAAIAGATRRAKLGIIHQAHFFRHPAIAAKMIATLDQLSGGRFIYFADTGTRGSEHQAYGLHYPAAMEERMPDFLEGLDLTLKLWQAGPANPLTYEGRYYHVKDAVCQPPPVTQPHPPIWFGEAHPLTLDACARLGQGLNSVPVGLAELRRRLDALRAACERVGRSFDELEISYETQILVAPTREDIRQKVRDMLALTPPGGTTPTDADFQAFVSGASDVYPKYLTDAWLVGTPEEVAGQIKAYLDIGATHFMLWFMDAPAADGMRLFAEQVAPQFRTQERIS